MQLIFLLQITMFIVTEYTNVCYLVIVLTSMTCDSSDKRETNLIRLGCFYFLKL